MGYTFSTGRSFGTSSSWPSQRSEDLHLRQGADPDRRRTVGSAPGGDHRHPSQTSSRFEARFAVTELKKFPKNIMARSGVSQFFDLLVNPH